MRTALPVAVAAAIASLGLAAAVPLTWDEAWNFLHVSSHGLRTVLTSYEQPNNHVLFSALQSAIPADLIARHPALLRLPNAAVACALAALLARRAPSAWLAVPLLLCSPLFTLYLCVARGYLLGTLFLLAAIAAAERPVLAGALGGLSAACVPTFAFALPGAVLALRAGRVRALAMALAVFAIADAGVLLEMARQRERWGLEWHAFARMLVMPAWPAHLCLALALLLLVGTRPRGLALGLLGAAASALLVIVALAVAGIADPPYPRNLLFVPLFLWLSVLLAARARKAAVALLCLSALFEVGWLAASLRDPNAHPYLRELTPTPLGRAADFGALSCDHQATPLCELYARGRPVGALAAVPDKCAVGSVQPPPGQNVALEPGARLLCY